MSRAKLVNDGEGRFYGIRIDCPGCRWSHDGSPSAHVIQTDWMPPGYERTHGARPDLWGFNGDLESPTFSPSLLIQSERYVPPVTSENIAQWNIQPWEQQRVPCVCHSFIRNGRIEFLSDCTHALAGQTVDLPEIGEG